MGVDLLHVLLNEGSVQLVIVGHLPQRVCSHALQVVLSPYFGLVRQVVAIKLNFSESLEVVIARVEAEPSLVVE